MKTITSLTESMADSEIFFCVCVCVTSGGPNPPPPQIANKFLFSLLFHFFLFTEWSFYRVLQGILDPIVYSMEKWKTKTF